jgi:hypothetical protein
MLIVLVVLAALVVFAIAAATVGGTVARLAERPSTAVLEVEDAVDWIAERLPFEVAATLSHEDVRRILRWHLDYFDTIGMASEFGEDIGGDVVPFEHDPVVAEADESADYVVGRALAAGVEITPLEVVVVLDLQMQYLAAIGAIGPAAGDDDDLS